MMMKKCCICDHKFNLELGGCGYHRKYICQNCLDGLPIIQERRPDRNIKLIIKINGKIVETSSIVSALEQMYYNGWLNCPIMTIGNLSLSLKRKSIPAEMGGNKT